MPSNGTETPPCCGTDGTNPCLSQRHGDRHGGHGDLRAVRASSWRARTTMARMHRGHVRHGWTARTAQAVSVPNLVGTEGTEHGEHGGTHGTKSPIARHPELGPQSIGRPYISHANVIPGCMRCGFASLLKLSPSVARPST